MNVAVLGCGPAGLAVAHAARQAGADVVVYSRKRKSELFGAQYLHKPIPGMTDTAPVTVTVELLGTHEIYRKKVYGDKEVPSVSTETLEPTHDAWDIRRTYDNLWLEYSSAIANVDLGGLGVVERIVGAHDMILNTVPLPVLCLHSRHSFRSQTVLAVGDAPERGTFIPEVIRAPRNTIICSGTFYESWYRIANVFGYATAEYPLSFGSGVTFQSEQRNGRTMALSNVRKPIGTDCDCWPSIVRLGRYGKWKKAELVNDAYEEALAACVTATV